MSTESLLLNTGTKSTESFSDEEQHYFANHKLNDKLSDSKDFNNKNYQNKITNMIHTKGTYKYSYHRYDDHNYNDLIYIIGIYNKIGCWFWVLLFLLLIIIPICIVFSGYYVILEGNKQIVFYDIMGNLTVLKSKIIQKDCQQRITKCISTTNNTDYECIETTKDYNCHSCKTEIEYIVLNKYNNNSLFPCKENTKYYKTYNVKKTNIKSGQITPCWTNKKCDKIFLNEYINDYKSQKQGHALLIGLNIGNLFFILIFMIGLLCVDDCRCRIACWCMVMPPAVPYIACLLSMDSISQIYLGSSVIFLFGVIYSALIISFLLYFKGEYSTYKKIIKNGKTSFNMNQWRYIMSNDDRYDYIMSYWMKLYCNTHTYNGYLCNDIQSLIYQYSDNDEMNGDI